jgi:hypothetical protein
MTLLKHEPSAQMPWQNTMLGLVPFILLSCSYGCGEVKSFSSRPLCAITLAATVLPVLKEIGGDSAAVIRGRDCDFPLRSTSLKARKRRAVQLASRLSLSVAEWVMTRGNRIITG